MLCRNRRKPTPVCRIQISFRAAGRGTNFCWATTSAIAEDSGREYCSTIRGSSERRVVGLPGPGLDRIPWARKSEVTGSSPIGTGSVSDLVERTQSSVAAAKKCPVSNAIPPRIPRPNRRTLVADYHDPPGRDRGMLRDIVDSPRFEGPPLLPLQGGESSELTDLPIVRGTDARAAKVSAPRTGTHLGDSAEVSVWDSSLWCCVDRTRGPCLLPSARTTATDCRWRLLTQSEGIPRAVSGLGDGEGRAAGD